MNQQWHSVDGNRHVWDRENMTAQDLAEAREVSDHLEQTIRNAINAINSRDFSIDGQAWRPVSEDYERVNKNITGGTRSKREFLEQFQRLTTSNPDFTIEITGMTTNVYKKFKRAEVIAESRSTGVVNMPLGIARSSMSIYHFELRNDGEWRCTREVTLPGPGTE